MNITVRQGDKAFLPEILELAGHCGLEKWSADDLEMEMASRDAILLIAFGEPRHLAGFIHGRIVPSAHPDGGTDLEVLNIAVSEGCRKKGVGRRLLGTLFEKTAFRSPRAAWLEVRASNLNAINFYTNLGFRACGTRRHFYSSPIEDAVLMYRTLDDPKR